MPPGPHAAPRSRALLLFTSQQGSTQQSEEVAPISTFVDTGVGETGGTALSVSSASSSAPLPRNVGDRRKEPCPAAMAANDQAFVAYEEKCAAMLSAASSSHLPVAHELLVASSSVRGALVERLCEDRKDVLFSDVILPLIPWADYDPDPMAALDESRIKDVRKWYRKT